MLRREGRAPQERVDARVGQEDRANRAFRGSSSSGRVAPREVDHLAVVPRERVREREVAIRALGGEEGVEVLVGEGGGK